MVQHGIVARLRFYSCAPRMVALSEFARSKHAKRIIAAMAAVGVAAVIWSSGLSVPVERVPSQPTRVAIFTAGIGDNYFNMTLVQMAATRRHFCAGKQHYDTHFFVFTDRNASTGAVSDAGVTFIHKQRLGWPRDSDDRYSWLIEAGSLLDGFDYALWMDADNHLIADCCEDLLGTLVALRHGWSYSAEHDFGYESNEASQAYVPQSQKHVNPYFSAHIFGGTVDEFRALAETCANWTLIDREAGIKAVWDDESYLQRYFKEHAPTVTLSFAFLYPEGKDVPWAATVKPMGMAMLGGHGRRLKAALPGSWGSVALDFRDRAHSRQDSRRVSTEPVRRQ